MVGHVFLFNPGILQLKKYMQDGELGRTYYAYAARTNLGPFRYDVNALWDLAAGWAIMEEAGGTVEVWLDEKKKAAGNFYHVSFIASSHEIVHRLLQKLKSL